MFLAPMLAQANSVRIGVLALVLGLGLGTASAAAAPNKASFDPVAGQVLPVVGGQTAIDLACGAEARNDCAGRVLLVPRGPAAEALGDGPVATSKPLDADRGEDLAPRMKLSDAALAWVRENGPLPVTAVLRIPGVDPTQPFWVDKIELVKAPPPTRQASSSALATASAATLNTETFRWDFKLKAGTAVALREFRCPSSAEYVAQGSDSSSRAGYTGDIRIYHSDGVGYGAFDDVIVKPFWEPAFQRQWTLSGWSQGGWFSNNVFAPVFEGGTFAMIVTCTNSNPFGYAWKGGENRPSGLNVGKPVAAAIDQVYGQGRFEDPYPTYLLLPWKTGGWR